MSDIQYITNKNARFYKTDGGFIGLKLGDNDYPRVSIIKAFPFSSEKQYLSCLDHEQKEIGIIENVEAFPEDVKQLFKIELDRRYFLPEIKEINSIKDEYGYSYWVTDTNLGERKFTIRRNNSSFINIKDNLILIIDVDGNRYQIPDYSKLDKKSYKKIELML